MYLPYPLNNCIMEYYIKLYCKRRKEKQKCKLK